MDEVWHVVGEGERQREGKTHLVDAFVAVLSSASVLPSSPCRGVVVVVVTPP